MTIEEIKQRLSYARDFTPHKIGYYEQLLKEAEKTNCTYCGRKYADTMCKLHPAPCKNV